MRLFSVGFQLKPDMVQAFARLTGDYNSMHLNSEIARKSRYRRTVVHGMLPFSYLQLIGRQFAGRQLLLKSVDGRFIQPLFENDLVQLEVEYEDNQSGDFAFTAKWYRGKYRELVIAAKGRMMFSDIRPTSHQISSESDVYIADPLVENQYRISEMRDQSAEIDFQVSEKALLGYVETCLNPGVLKGDCDAIPSDPNLMAALMLSPMVGMQLPGRYATFTKFSLQFESNVPLNEKVVVAAHVEKCSEATEIMEAALRYGVDGASIATGKVEVMLNPVPPKMVDCEEIKRQFRDMGVSGKVVLITGASRGIGETTAKLFGMLGAKVILNYYRGREDAERIVDDIVEHGGEAFAVQCDITDENSVAEMIEKSLTIFKKIDVLVNNAVRDFTPKNILDMHWEDYDDEFQVSIKGMHSCCKEVIPIFIREGGGKIVNLSSIAVHNPVAGQSRYITAKSAIEGYTKSLSKELLKYNIQANVVVPNMADTDLVSVLPSMYRDKIAESRPYNRHVKPVEVAQSIVFLGSRWADAITGQKIVLNLGEPPFA